MEEALELDSEEEEVAVEATEKDHKIEKAMETDHLDIMMTTRKGTIAQIGDKTEGMEVIENNMIDHPDKTEAMTGKDQKPKKEIGITIDQEKISNLDLISQDTTETRKPTADHQESSWVEIEEASEMIEGYIGDTKIESTMEKEKNLEEEIEEASEVVIEKVSEVAIEEASEVAIEVVSEEVMEVTKEPNITKKDIDRLNR